MEMNEAREALGQTVTQLQGGVLRLSVASAIPVISAWEQTLRATSTPKLAAVADNLGTLRSRLAAGDSDAGEIGQLLQTLGAQVQALLASPLGLPVAAPLAQLSLFLNAGGATLAMVQGMSR